MPQISIEGEDLEALLEWSEEQFDELVLVDRPLVIRIGSADVLGQFACVNERLLVELAQIDGGGEGVLLAVSRLANRVARLKGIIQVEWVVHAVTCAKPNLKLRAFLEKRGFRVEDVHGKGLAYRKLTELKDKQER